MNRCIQSGLWVPDASTLAKDEDYEEVGESGAKTSDKKQAKTAEAGDKDPVAVKKKPSLAESGKQEAEAGKVGETQKSDEKQKSSEAKKVESSKVAGSAEGDHKV